MHGPHEAAFAIRGPILRSDLPGLCDRVCGLLARRSSDVLLCDVAGVGCDAVTVDALARLQLAARRTGCQVRLCRASDELLELVAFMGLEDVLPGEPSELRPVRRRTRAGARTAGRPSPRRGRT
jgi:ABC-type transporter Mla MlaB component